MFRCSREAKYIAYRALVHRGVPIIGLANRYSRYWLFLLNIGIGLNWLYNRYYYRYYYC